MTMQAEGYGSVSWRIWLRKWKKAS